MDRTTLKSLMESAEKRTVGYVQKWLTDSDFKAAVHRYDRDRDGRDGDSVPVAKRA